MKLIEPLQFAVVDRFTGLALSLHSTEQEARLATPRRPSFEHHPGFSVQRVLVSIEPLPPCAPMNQLSLLEARHVA
jgi:hypothetical protein